MRHRPMRRQRPADPAGAPASGRVPLRPSGRSCLAPAALALALCGAQVPATAIAQQDAPRAPFSLDDRFAVLLDRIDELEASLVALREERDALAASGAADASLRDRVVELEARLATAADRERDALERLEMRAAELAGELDRARAEADAAVAARDALRAGADRELGALAAELDRLAAELEAERERAAAEVVAGDERAATELDALRAALERAEAERDDARAELAVSEARATSLATRLAAADDEVARLGETIVAGERAADAVERRIAGMMASRDGADGADGAGGEADAPSGSAAIAEAPSADPNVAPGDDASCEDALESRVAGVVATLVVTNPCRAGGTLAVRSARPLDPLIAQLRAGFDGAGRAELVFPVLEPESRLRVFGAERDDWQDVTLSPGDGADGDLVVLRWEDALVDLDLVLAPEADGGDAFSGGAPDEGPSGGDAFGTRLLAQGAEADQLPRFEVVAVDPGAPALALGVARPDLGEVAEAPFCGDADAAAPRVRVVLRDAGELQLVREALDPVACGEPVPDARRVSRLRTLR